MFGKNELSLNIFLGIFFLFDDRSCFLFLFVGMLWWLISVGIVVGYYCDDLWVYFVFCVLYLVIRDFLYVLFFVLNIEKNSFDENLLKWMYREKVLCYMERFVFVILSIIF